MTTLSKLLAPPRRPSRSLAARPRCRRQDYGYKLMMTPKWTGFPYFEAARRGRRARRPRNSATSSSMPAPTMPT